MLNPDYKIEKLPNGITLVMEEIGHLRSVAVGILLGVGSKNESEKNAGISHYIEHMLFKGTAKRSARDIAEEIDAVGGRLNAHTSKEYTSYYAEVLDSHVDIAIDILADMYLNSVFDQNELNTERNVILEEINMYEDTPDENIHDLATQNILDGHTLGKPIIGRIDSVKKIDREAILKFLKDYYTPDNTIIAVAGNFKAEKVISLIKEKFGKHAGKKFLYQDQEAHIKPGIKTYKKNTEQVHLCLSTKGLSYENEDRYGLSLLSSVLGGNMSSRLFQKVREQKGLVYSIFSYPTYYRQTGIFTLYAGTNLKNINEVIEISLQELREIKQNSISAVELVRSKEQLKGNMVLSMESSSSRMSWLGKSFYYYNKIDNLETVFKKIDKVTADDVQRLANNLFIKENMQLTAIGNFANKKLVTELLC